MKEFEKWWKKFIPFELHKGDDRNKVKKEYEKAWKAALEWVLADLKAARDGFDLNLYDTLNKELGGTEKYEKKE